MRITCPNCQTAYDVSDEKLAGRMVRCARCATDWTPVPEAVPAPAGDSPAESLHPLMAAPLIAGLAPPQPAPAALQEPPPIVVPPREAPAAAQPPQQAAIFAWVASLIVIVAAVAASYVWRADVMQAWPPSQRAYHAIGLN